MNICPPSNRSAGANVMLAHVCSINYTTDCNLGLLYLWKDPVIDWSPDSMEILVPRVGVSELRNFVTSTHQQF